jgi:hypothetical protein
MLLSFLFMILNTWAKDQQHEGHFADQLLIMILNIGASCSS